MQPAERLTALFGRRRFAIKPGTERIKALLARLGHPERALRAIHVVGTNGKGSTASFLAAILKQAGHRTGLFTSPHLVRFNERFRIDGGEVDDELLDRTVERLLAQAHPDDTFFELTTALACLLFAEQGVDLAILEAGMGGRADATAAVTAQTTLLTPISRDHTQWLGESCAAIAAEKVAIAEPGTPLICAPQPPSVMAVIEQHCASNANRLILAERDFSISVGDPDGYRYHGLSHQLDRLMPGIPGSYQRWNLATALAAAELLDEQGISVPATALRSGIAAAHWPGRMERFQQPGHAEILLDGAHNPSGAQALAEALQSETRQGRLILLIGLMEDKEIDGVIVPLAALAHRIVSVAPQQERALSAQKLAEHCRALGYAAESGGTVAATLMQQLAASAPHDLLVVAGSLFVVGEARAALTGSACEAVRG